MRRESIAPGFRANVNHRIAYAGGFAVENFVMLENAQREDIHQRVALIALLEHAFAAHSGHTETVPIMGDAAHDAL